MESRLIICAQAVSIDQRSNSVSVFNILEELNVPAFPFAISYMAVAMLLSRTSEEPSDPTNLSLRFYLNDEQTFRTVLAPKFQQQLRMRFVVDVQSLVIQRPCTMRVVVTEDDRELGSWKIFINNIAPTVVASPQ